MGILERSYSKLQINEATDTLVDEIIIIVLLQVLQRAELMSQEAGVGPSIRKIAHEMMSNVLYQVARENNVQDRFNREICLLLIAQDNEEGGAE